LSEFEKAVGKNTLDLLTQAMKTPQGAANALNQLPAAERNKLLKLMADPSQWSSKTGLSSTAAIRETIQSLTTEE
jgi:hypothetical protein